MIKTLFNCVKKSLSIVLCIALVMSFANLPASALSVSRAADLSVGDTSSSGFTTVGASLATENDTMALSDRTEGSKPVQTTTNRFVYVKDDVPRYNARYVIYHEGTGNLMSYQAYNPVPATSISYNQSGDASGVYYFQENSDGTLDKNSIFFDHSDRDSLLWALRQTISFEYGTGDENKNAIIQSNEELSIYTNKATGKVAAPFLGGEKRYHHAYFYKGLGSTWNSNGTVNVTNNGTYWYSVSGADAVDVQERYLTFHSDHAEMYGIDNVNTQIELLDDGTFLIFRRDTSTNPDTYYVLTCDENGNWVADGIEEITETTLPNYKLSLYRYENVYEYKYVNFKGHQKYDVVAGTSKDAVLQSIYENITVMNSTDKDLHIPYSGETGKVGYYWLEFSSEFDSSADRTQNNYNVLINYRNDDGSDTKIGSVTVTVHDEMVVAGTGAIVDAKGTVPQNAAEGYVVENIVGEEVTDCVFTVKVNTADGVKTKTVPVSVGMLTDAAGNRVVTAANGTYSPLKVNYMGEVITEEFTLTVDDSNPALNYPIYPTEGGSVNVTKTGTAMGNFNETGVANINLSTTGIPLNKGVDMIVIMDLSGSMRYGVTNTNYVTEETYETSRIFALQESLKALINTLKSSNIDYRIAMSDFGDIDSYDFDGAIVDKKNPAKFFFDSDLDGTWDQRGSWQFGTRREFYNHLNYVHGTYGEDVTDADGNVTDNDNRAMPYNVHEKKYEKAYPSYTGTILPRIYTGSHTVGADAFVNVDTFDDAAIDSLIDDVALQQRNSIGTNYDIGLEYAYQLGHAIQEENIANGEDRDIICVFMSDGAAMQYNYFSGRATGQSWADWLKGDIEFSAFQHNEPTDPSASPALVDIMSGLLTRLKNGKLENPKYGVRESVLNASGERPTYAASGLLAYVEKNDSEGNAVKYFDFSAVDISNAATFYDAMEVIGVNLHWELLSRIAKANGLNGFATAADVEDELLALAKNSELKYPDDQEQYYPQYTGASDDFFTAMKEIDVNCDWELFSQIAIENVSDSLLDDVYAELTTLGEGMQWGTLSPYYYFYNEDGKNWYAEAIKGSSDKLYPVINKNAFSNNVNQPFAYYGDVRNKFDTGTGLELDGKDYISGYRGLNIPIYTVGLSLCTEGYLEEQITKNVLSNISSGPAYDFTANNKEELTDVFNTIGASSSAAATGAYFVDKMGPEFDLYTKRTVVNGDGETVTINVQPQIRVLEYNLDSNYERTGAPIVYETVTISEDEDGNLIVTSDKIYTTVEDANGNLTQVYPNILQSDGVIKAKYFFYNTNKYVNENKTGTVGIDLTGDGVGDWQLEAETFFWIIGRIGNTEMVLDYQVYLTDSLEGNRELGVYETNTKATLGYVNYLGNSCSKNTVSPAFPWPSPFAGYAFYLVDENGVPLNADGNNSSFIDSFKITSPEYIEMLLNGAANVIDPDSILTEEQKIMYELYDPNVEYKVAVNSDNSGYWQITDTEGLSDTTYVTNYGGAPTTKNSSDITSTVAYDRTVVWFALKVKNTANPDTIVVDFGIPVNSYVLENDTFFGDEYTLDYLSNTSVFDSSLSAAQASDNTITLSKYLSNIPASDTSLISTTTADGIYGKATINGDSVNYALSTSNGMQMSEEEVFVYGAHYAGTGNSATGRGYYYSTLTVIPATTIYYEDNFVNFNVYDHDTGDEITAESPIYDKVKWNDEGSPITDATQAEDRPGDYPLASIDADNIYGYDGAYTEMNMHSLGTSKFINVGNHTFEDGTTAKTRGTADFTFKGTGFDIISVTGNTTGTIFIQVVGKDEGSTVNQFHMVDTYYGYKYNGSDWVVDTDAEGALYQIPVMKIEDLPYGTYDVTITVAYAELFDHQQYGDAQNFDFYLDAIRIYDPANDGDDSDVIKNAYISDGEGWPAYEEVRNLILNKKDFGSIEDNSVVNGVVFIDNTNLDPATGKPVPAISDYLNYGPNNELYLAPGQAVAFELDNTGIDRAHIALKSVDGKSANIKMFDATTNVADAEVKTISTATDLYYDITTLGGKTVVIYNCGDSTDGILSVTNIKTTYAADPGDSVTPANNTKMSQQSAVLALRAFEEKPAESTVETTIDESSVTTTNTDVTESTVADTTTSADVQETTDTNSTDTTAPSVSETQATSTDAQETTQTETASVSTETTVESTSADTTASSPDDDFILGDTTFDGIVNVKDATLIQKFIADLLNLEGVAYKAADYDCSGKVNVKDATAIQKSIAGLE